MKTEKKTYRSGPFQDIFAEGTQVGNTLYLSGQVGIDQDGNTPTGIANQNEGCLPEYAGYFSAVWSLHEQHR